MAAEPSELGLSQKDLRITPSPDRKLHLVPNPDGENKYVGERQRLRQRTERKGTILPPEHMFTQVVTTASNRLLIPQGTEQIAVDSEELNAFFDPKANTVVLHRGIARYLVDQGLDVTEDHIAAIMAHEIEHAEVLGDEYVKKIEDSMFQRLKNTQGHAEEYRADVKAMRRLSKAGYNPRAIIEVYRALSLTAGRDDLGHPEQIDRIRKLEDALADDELPLSHTSKPMTPLSEDLQKWIREDSHFYDKADDLISKSVPELTESVNTATTQLEFWDAYKMLRHKTRIVAAKKLIDTDAEAIDQLLHTLIMSKAYRNANNGYAKSISQLDLDKTFITKALTAVSFRQQVTDDIDIEQIVGNSQSRITDTEAQQKEITDQISETFDETIKEEQRADKVLLQNAARHKTLSKELLQLAFKDYDIEQIMAGAEKNRRESREKGRRAGDEYTGFSFDFSDANDTNYLYEALRLELAMKLIVIPPEHLQGMKPQLEIVIIHDTGLDPRSTEIVADTMVKRADATNWIKHLWSLPKEELIRTIESAGKINDVSLMPVSPLRWLHHSLKSSISDEFGTLPNYGYAGKYLIDTSGLSALQRLPIQELYMRGYPDGHNTGFYDSKLHPRDNTLAFDDWEKFVNVDPLYRMSDEFHEWLLSEYINDIRNKAEVDPRIVESMQEIQGYPYGAVFNAQELERLIQNPPWDSIQLLKVIDGGLGELPRGEEIYYEENENGTGIRKERFVLNNTHKERLDVLRVLKLAYDLRKKYPSVIETGSNTRIRDKQEIAAHMLDVLSQDLQAGGLSKEVGFIAAIKELSKNGVEMTTNVVNTRYQNDVWQGISYEQFSDLISFLKEQKTVDSDHSAFIEALTFLQLSVGDINRETVSDVITEKTITTVIEQKNDGAIKWVLENFTSTARRDALLSTIINYASEDLRKVYVDDAKGQFVCSPDESYYYKSSDFDFISYAYRKHKAGEEAKGRRAGYFNQYKGQGQLAERFDDIMLRRYAFIPLARRVSNFDKNNTNPSYANSFELNHKGSGNQRHMARQILSIEPELFDLSRDLSDRLSILQDAAPFPSVVRNIELEMLLEDELKRAENDEEKVSLGRIMLPLFTEGSALKPPFAAGIFRSELVTKPELLTDFDAYLRRLQWYLPDASFSRNYFLGLIENSVSVTPDQLKQIEGMRISSEGNKEEDDNSPEAYFVNKLGELDRTEKAKAVLWMLGVSKDKPINILKNEERFDGHFDSLPGIIAAQTNNEREILFKRLFLGAEGLVDLEAVAPKLLNEATEQRHAFLSTFSETLLPADMPNAALFRKLFIGIIEASDPTHAARTLTAIINKLSAARVEGRQLPPEEVLATTLTELGVVGKKVAQSLAEMDWVPESYRDTLKKAQSEGEIVPKRALAIMAEDAGLLDDSSPIKIVSFDNLLGAASNKQACLLTIDVKEARPGLPIGRQQVVGKFKRPSAQKVENLEHDLKVFEKVLDIVRDAGHASTLPQNFSLQISNAVRRELDFAREQKFNIQLKDDMKIRNLRRIFPVRVPDIVFSADDVMLETRAQGMSLRDFYDQKKDGTLAAQYARIRESDINQTILTESLAQLIATGNLHGDLHPGNIFVDHNAEITFIDLGMHEELSKEQRLETMALLTGIVMGNERMIKNTLHRLGWSLSDAAMGLKKFDFEKNSLSLLQASQKAAESPPEFITSILVATSKLNTYTHNISYVEIFKSLRQMLDKKDVFDFVNLMRKTEGANIAGDILNLFYPSR